MPRPSAAPPPAPVTLIDVARVAGVAPMTVSRALNRPELVREGTRKRVLDAVRATGYVPNLLAGGLAARRSRLIAVLLPTIANSIFADTVQALMRELAAAGYQTLIGLTDYDPQTEESLVEALLGRRPDGIVLAGIDHTPATRERLKQALIPVVEIWDQTDDPIDMVIGFSHEAVGVAVAEYLAGKAYKRVGIVSVNDPRGRRRCKSLQTELARRGMNHIPLEVVPAPATFEGGRDGLNRLLARHAPDVVVCSSDTLAAGVMAEAQRRALRVPDDLAVMGFGDLSLAAHLHPALSTVRVGGERIGRQTAQALLASLEDRTASPSRVDVGFEIVARASA